MEIIALAAAASFVVAGASIGLRLLLLARRTRRAPELLLGAGLASLTFVTLPAIGASLGARLGSAGLQTSLFAIGLVPVVGFVMCLYAFTARVFRSGRGWARALIGLAGAFAAVGVVGTVWTRLTAWEADRVVGVGWTILLMAPFVLGMLWTGIESLRQHRLMRRRVALGLADPVVSNRFLLWALGNLGAVAGTLVMAVSLLLGWRVVEHPVPMLGLSAAGLTLSVSWLLAFLPPGAYLAYLRSRPATA